MRHLRPEVRPHLGMNRVFLWHSFSFESFVNNIKAIRLPLWLSNKKAMGPYWSPMACSSHIERPLWVTLIKIKIKVKEIKDASHWLSFFEVFITYPIDLSR